MHSTTNTISKIIWIMITILFAVSCQTSEEVVSDEQAEAEVTSSTESSPISSPIETPVPSPTPTAVNLVEPEPDLAALQGTVFANSTLSAIGDTQYYLVEAVGENKDLVPPLLAGPQANDIVGKTNDDGSFAMTNIPPGNYYMIIWAPLNWIVLADPSGIGDRLPILLELKANETRDIGKMTITWP